MDQFINYIWKARYTKGTKCKYFKLLISSDLIEVELKWRETKILKTYAFILTPFSKFTLGKPQKSSSLNGQAIKRGMAIKEKIIF